MRQSSPAQFKARLIAVTLVVSLVSMFPFQAPEVSAQGGAHCFDRDPLDVGIVLDRSGSMGSTRMEAAKDGAQILINKLTGQDQSGLVDYDNTVTITQHMGFDHAATSNAVETLYARGSTATGDAIAVSHQEFLDHQRVGVARPIMVLLTDGFTNFGQDPVAAAQAAKGAGIEIYAIGVGSNVNTPELQAIASEPVEQYFHNPITNQDMIEVFAEIANLITRNDLEDPTVAIGVPEAGHLYINGVDHGPGSGIDATMGTVLGTVAFTATADDDCWLENVAFTTSPPVGWSYQRNATNIITSPFNCNAVPPGIYDLHADAVDWVGNTSADVKPFRCARLEGESLALGVWAGNTLPESAEYSSDGARLRDAGHLENRAVVVNHPAVPVYADAVEEIVTRSDTPTTRTASGSTQLAEVDLLGGLIHLEGLNQDATVTYDVGSLSSTWASNPELDRIIINGQDHSVPAGPQDIPLPGGGFVRLFERTVEQTPGGIVLRENLVHVYLENDVYGRSEIILGSLVLQAGLSIPSAAQDRVILEQDDAATGGDVGDDLGSAHMLDPGVYQGSLPGDDSIDVYAFSGEHGEKVTAALAPAVRATVTGGGATLDGSTPPLSVDEPHAAASGMARFALRLYDGEGDLREYSEIEVDHAPQRLELNMDEPGPWFLEVSRFPGHSDVANNYTLSFGVTPVPLLPQNDALSNADAPATCVVGGGGAPQIMNGTWPGVLRDDDWADVYQFEAQIGHIIAATLKPGETADGADMAFELYDRDCNLLSRSDLFSHLLGTGVKGGPEAVLGLPAQLTGTYYLRVERINGVANHYVTLRVEDPMPNVQPQDGGTGTDAPSGGGGPTMTSPVFQGRLHEGDTGDSYQIPLEGNHRSFIAFEIGATSRAFVELRDPNGVVVPISNANHIGQQVVLWDFQATSGSHTLMVYPDHGGGDYTVEVAQVRNLPVTLPPLPLP